MSGASGKVPAAIHVSPEALAGGPLGQGARRRPDPRSTPSPARSRRWSTRPSGRRARSRRCRRRRPTTTATASAASCSPACARNVTQRRGGRLHMAVADPSGMLEHARPRRLRPGDSGDRASSGSSDAVPMARALVDGGVRVLEVTLRTPAALACIEAIARGGARGHRRRRHGAQRRRRARGAATPAARFARQPGLHAARRPRPAATLGLPLLPGVATASEVMAGQRRRLPLPEVLSRRGGRRHRPMLKALAGPFADVAFCPTGGITLETRAAVPGAAQRQGRAAARG